MIKRHQVAIVEVILSLAVVGGNFACAHESVVEAPLHYAGLDVYGTTRLTDQELQSRAGDQLDRCLELYLHKDENYINCKEAALNPIQGTYHFAYADFSVIQYFTSGNPVYVTLDVVEPEDASKRMDFLSRPNGHFDDPGGLIKAWNEYINLGFELLAEKQISGQRVDCPAFHCIFGFQHPKLKPYEQVFVDGVKKNGNVLEQIFLKSHDDQQRASTAFLLAFEKSGNHLVSILSKRIRDESPEVRNNILRVFSDIAMYHHDLALPIEKVIVALNFPTTTDRNKASAVLLGIVANKELLSKYRSKIMKGAVPILLQTLRLKQPNNHDMAYNILRILSGANYGERDYESWDRWYEDQKP